MNYTLSDSFGYKIHFYSLNSVFEFIERSYFQKTKPKFYYYDFFRIVGTQFVPIISSGGFAYKNIEARIWDNFTYSYHHDCYIYRDYYKIATNNLYILTDIHGYSVDMQSVRERYYARCADKFNLNRKKSYVGGIYGSCGYKSSKNQAKILTRRYKATELKSEYAKSLIIDDCDKMAPVRAKRKSLLKSTIMRDYDYFVHSCDNPKSWKNSKKKKQWL